VPVDSSDVQHIIILPKTREGSQKRKATQFFVGQKLLGLGSLKNVAMRFAPIGCAPGWMSADAAYALIGVVGPAKGNGATWWS